MSSQTDARPAPPAREGDQDLSKLKKLIFDLEHSPETFSDAEKSSILKILNTISSRLSGTGHAATLSLEEASAFLHIHSVTLLRKAQAGIIPGAKIGKRWIFLQVDLMSFVRSQYVRQALLGEAEVSQCHSSSAKTRRTGGLNSQSTEKRYNEVLGLRIKDKPRNSTTD